MRVLKLLCLVLLVGTIVVLMTAWQSSVVTYDLGASVYIKGQNDGAPNNPPYVDVEQFVPAPGKTVTIKSWYLQPETSTSTAGSFVIQVVSSCDTGGNPFARHGISHSGAFTLSGSHLDQLANPTMTIALSAPEGQRIAPWGTNWTSPGNAGFYMNDSVAPQAPTFVAAQYKWEPGDFIIPSGGCAVVWYYSSGAYHGANLPSELRVMNNINFTEQ